MVRAALHRAQAYAQAGADGLFVPGVIDETLIERLVEGSPLPVNIMVEQGTPSLSRLSELGVARQPWAGALSRDDEYVERSRPYGGKRGFAPQHVELVSKDKDLGLQRNPGPEQSDQGAPDQPAKVAHRERVSGDSRSRSAVLGLR
jgi:hypothetical protein